MKEKLYLVRSVLKKNIEGGKILTGKKTKPSEALLLNEAINFEKQCIFIAVPKNGTVSVRKQIHLWGLSLIENPHLNIMQIRDSMYVYFLKKSLGKNYTFPNGSVLRDADIRKKANKIFNDFFKFSAVRNPWSRAVSLYFRREGIQVKDTITFEDFCDRHLYASDTCIHPTLHKNQMDWFCDENGKCVMDYVYTDISITNHLVTETL